MTYVVLLVFSIIFIESFLFLDLGVQARRIVSVARESFRVIGSQAHTDLQKEQHLRRASRAVSGATAVLALKFAAITAGLGLAFAAITLMHPDTGQRLLAMVSSPMDVAVVTVAACAYGWLRHAIHR
jgi:hypothetical protein